MVQTDRQTDMLMTILCSSDKDTSHMATKLRVMSMLNPSNWNSEQHTDNIQLKCNVDSGQKANNNELISSLNAPSTVKL